MVIVHAPFSRQRLDGDLARPLDLCPRTVPLRVVSVWFSVALLVLDSVSLLRGRVPPQVLILVVWVLRVVSRLLGRGGVPSNCLRNRWVPLGRDRWQVPSARRIRGLCFLPLAGLQCCS